MQTALNGSDYENFLIKAYFGEHCFAQPILACVDRAYLDFNRTLRGLSNLPRAEELHQKMRDFLTTEINVMRHPHDEMTQTTFDNWHSRTCASMIDSFADFSFQFHAGQAQKWINMTLKYAFTFGEARIPGYSAIYQFCHAPIDRIVIESLTPLGFPKISKPWSQLDYDEYAGCQKWIRNQFDIPPLDVEFRAWQKSDYDLRSAMRQPQQI